MSWMLALACNQSMEGDATRNKRWTDRAEDVQRIWQTYKWARLWKWKTAELAHRSTVYYVNKHYVNKYCVNKYYAAKKVLAGKHKRHRNGATKRWVILLTVTITVTLTLKLTSLCTPVSVFVIWAMLELRCTHMVGWCVYLWQYVSTALYEWLIVRLLWYSGRWETLVKMNTDKARTQWRKRE